jgi:hypothetical protein
VIGVFWKGARAENQRDCFCLERQDAQEGGIWVVNNSFTIVISTSPSSPTGEGARICHQQRACRSAGLSRDGPGEHRNNFRGTVGLLIRAGNFQLMPESRLIDAAKIQARRADCALA